MKQSIRFTLNSKPVTLNADADRSVLWVLRTEYGLTGTKYGCGEGHCGACTILVDYEAMQACQLTLVDVMDTSVITIEGLAINGTLHPIQQAFMDLDALQCGYCTPGMILTAVALLHKNQAPTEVEIIGAMNGNLCRCGSYRRIVQAIQSAANAVQEGR